MLTEQKFTHVASLEHHSVVTYDELRDELKSRWAPTCLSTMILGGFAHKTTLPRLVETAATCD